MIRSTTREHGDFHFDNPVSFGFAPQGSLLLADHGAGMIGLLDCAAENQAIAWLNPRAGDLLDLHWDSAGTRLWTLHDDGRLREYGLSTEELSRLARRLLEEDPSVTP